MNVPTLTSPHNCSHSPSSPVRILVVDDSVTMRLLISRMLAGEAMLEVVGTAKNGLDALAKLSLCRPHLVTLDIEMPELDGLGALRLIEERYPDVRVIMFSSLTTRGSAATIDALMTGADDYVTKPAQGELSEAAYNTLKNELIKKIKAIFRFDEPNEPPTAANSVLPESSTLALRSQASALRSMSAPQMLVIGVSTGGPAALAELLPEFTSDFPLPIAIVQHMPPLFTRLLADRLTKRSRIEVLEASDGMVVKPGRAILAAGDFHLRITRRPSHIAVQLDQAPQENSCRPAVDVLFRSAAEVYGGNVIAVVLTGMGRDGLAGARHLKQLGATVVVQNSETSVVWGMPGAIANAKLADAILSLQEIAPAVLRRIG